MIELNHDFEPSQFARKIGDLAPYQDRYWVMSGVAGPYDVAQLLQVRELIRPYVTFGPPSPLDLFVFATGESPVRSWTKIGGLPFWRTEREWPRGTDGQQLPFLAQLNFQKSRDIVSNVPHDLLLIFGHPDLHNGLALEWEDVTRPGALVDGSSVPPSTIPAFFGYRWRCDAYPDAVPVEDEHWSLLTLPGGEEVLDIWNAFRVFGTQIGSHPPLRPDGIDLDPKDKILCSVATIRPRPDRPYPFVNHETPLEASEVERLSVEISDYPEGTDVTGQLLVIQHPNGALSGKLVYS
jgi:hypothetical protein